MAKRSGRGKDGRGKKRKKGAKIEDLPVGKKAGRTVKGGIPLDQVTAMPSLSTAKAGNTEPPSIFTDKYGVR